MIFCCIPIRRTATVSYISDGHDLPLYRNIDDLEGLKIRSNEPNYKIIVVLALLFLIIALTLVIIFMVPKSDWSLAEGQTWGAEIEPGIFDVYNETNYESPHLNATRQNLTQPL